MTKLDPRAKLFAILLMTTSAILFQDVFYMAILAVLSLMFCAILGGNLQSFFKKIKSFVSLLVAVCFAQIIFRRTGEPLWTINDFTIIYLDGVIFGVSTALRFLIILCSASVMASENGKRVMTSLSKMKIPYTFIFMITIALRFLPTFRESFSDSLTAMQLRGIDLEKIKWSKKIKLFSSLILPVVATAIVSSQDIAMSAEARGFGASKKRSVLVDVKMRAWDYLSILLFLVVFGGLIVIYYIL